ncbi:nucleotide disphospho-sugar-binding domain-containing protein [Arthrobacter sp. SX1312]|uniref:glycosyltransferase n=1 Tax=Arthrobacter sp. SX1312 TaxID=2058896 RepID=UPI000CE4C496|nr:nucleotide disphospho-sugar-binding domain-containing protein [Arthrobacter sp. SX1312]
MRTLLFAPVTFNLAETTRMIMIARALGPACHAVFQVYESPYVHLVRSAGFEVRHLGPVLSRREQGQVLALDQGRSLRHPFSPGLVRARVDAERRLLRETGAEAVVMGTNVTSLISARAEEVPLFYAVPFALTRPHVEQTPRLGLVTGAGRLSGVADGLASAALRLVYGRLPIAPRAFRIVARENGVRPLRTGLDLFEGDINLLTVMASELEGYHLPANYIRVGPIFAELPGEVPQLVHELAHLDRPLVYLALGSSGNRRTALRAAHTLGALEINVVAPIRHFLTPGDVAGLPTNVHVVDLLPAHRLGGLIDAAVLHGGQGTVQTACATGVPFVGIGMQPEQAWNVAACVRQGNAIEVSPRDAGTEHLAGAVRRLLTDGSFRAAAERERLLHADEDGPAAAARAIQGHLRPARSSV